MHITPQSQDKTTDWVRSIQIMTQQIIHHINSLRQFSASVMVCYDDPMAHYLSFEIDSDLVNSGWLERGAEPNNPACLKNNRICPQNTAKTEMNFLKQLENSSITLALNMLNSTANIYKHWGEKSN